MTDSDTVAEIRAIVSDPEMRRTRMRRDAIDRIQELVGVDVPAESPDKREDAPGPDEGEQSGPKQARTRGPRIAKDAPGPDEGE